MTTVTTDDFTFFTDYLRAQSAISLAPGKEYLVETRLAPVARDLGMPGIADLIASLRAPHPDPTTRDRVVEAMTTNETSFFRDGHPFEAVTGTIVPEVMRRRAGVRRLAIWSAACSTGQELYTTAMLLDTHFPALHDWSLNLYGTDLSTEVVMKARRGRFSPLEVNRGLPAQMLVKYFERDGAQYVIDERLRRQCMFDQMNLVTTWPTLPLFDLVYCRNVLIYFEVPVRRRILERIGRVLSPGGYLMLGASETTLGVVDGYTQVRIGNTVAYQLEESR